MQIIWRSYAGFAPNLTVGKAGILFIGGGVERGEAYV